MTTQFVLDRIPFHLDTATLQKKLRIKEGSRYVGDFDDMVRKAQDIGRPKALYKVALVESKADDHVVIDGIQFTSRVLRVNLEQAHRVFAYVATCGMELQHWADSLDDVLQRFWADTINETVLRSAIQALEEHLTERYHLGRTAVMNPGSLGDWPLREQRPLFALLGDPSKTIGVQLTKSCLMVPAKSVSGIRFPTENGYANCQLCPREDCPGRRAPYDRDLYDTKYRRRD